MFTGIVQAVGKIVRVTPLEIECAGFDLTDVRVGDSICVQGVCLTVTTLTGRGFAADVSPETRAVTAGLEHRGAGVNLEKSLALGERLGGHLVTGHVDGVGEVLTFASSVLTVRVPRELRRYVARKGSICVDDSAHAEGHHACPACAGRARQPGSRPRGALRRPAARRALGTQPYKAGN